jgi:hypothetical protein
MGFCPKFLGLRRHGSKPVPSALFLSVEKVFSLDLSE